MVMEGDPAETALARIEAAMARIEAAASRPITAGDGLVERHERLRGAVSQALSHLDDLIAGHEG